MNKIIQQDLQYIIESPIIDWKRFANKTILITGANGMLASYTVETLLYLNNEVLKDNPCTVIALVRNAEKASKKFGENRKGLVKICQDVSSPLYNIPKVNFIIHAASLASPKYYNESPVDVLLPNIIGTKNTLALAYQFNIEGYLFFSTGEIYNHMDTLNIRSCYGESKRMGEVLCTSYHHQYKVPTKIARIFHTYGPGMDLEGGRVFEDFVKNIINNENIELKSDGSAIRQFCYIADATIAFFKILLDGESGQAYDVANNSQKISVRDLAEVMVNLYPEKNLNYSFVPQDKAYLKSMTKEYIPDIYSINKLGWYPNITIEQGFKRTIESFETNN